MTDLEIVNQFLGRTDLTDTETIIKNRALGLDNFLEGARKEFKELSDKTNAKQAEIMSAGAQLDGLLALILDLEKAKQSPVSANTDTATVVATEVAVVDAQAQGE